MRLIFVLELSVYLVCVQARSHSERVAAFEASQLVRSKRTAWKRWVSMIAARRLQQQKLTAAQLHYTRQLLINACQTWRLHARLQRNESILHAAALQLYEMLSAPIAPSIFIPLIRLCVPSLCV